MRGLLTAGQQISDSYICDAFGNITAASGSTVNPYRYVGNLGYRRSDSASGLLHLSAREYNPATGRFLTQDPIGYAGGLNLYGYVGNDPTGWVDPEGLWGKAIHYKRTMYWLRTLGVSPWAAHAIARADQLTDSINWPAPGRHDRAHHQVAWVTGRDSRRTLAEEHFRNAQAAARRKDCRKVWAELGHGLHALQDISAHADRRFHPAFSDATSLNAYDPRNPGYNQDYDQHGKLDPDRSRILRAFAATKWYLRRALRDPDIGPWL